MKLLLLFILLSFTTKAQVFKSPADVDVKAANADSAFIIPALMPRPMYKTTLSKDKIVSVTLLMTKTDGSIIVVDSAWRMGIRKDIDKISIIYPDSTRTVYRIMERDVEDTLLTIPFTISKKIFDEMQTIKLEIIR